MAQLDDLIAMPKIELHAHLSGSVRHSTVLELIDEHNDRELDEYAAAARMDDTVLNIETTTSGTIDMHKAFECFAVLHRLLADAASVERVTREILDDFAADNVVYLELRTTPRTLVDKRNETTLSKRDHIDLIIGVIRDFEQRQQEQAMTVRLLLSVDRAKPLEENRATIELCREYMMTTHESPSYVVGLDFSGNPHVSDFSASSGLRDLLELARAYRLPTSVHIAETWSDTDVDFMVRQFRPERLGHAVCLSDEHVAHLLANPIPVEICPTSNLVTRCVERMEDHTFIELYERSERTYPLVVCTDDMGIFRTTLSREYRLVAATFGIALRDMFEMSRRSAAYIFDRAEFTRQRINARFDAFTRTLDNVPKIGEI